MVKPRQLIEESEGEEYLHKVVWRVVQRQIDYAERNPKGALYDDLAAMVFAFQALEGYLNFAGEKIAPDLWRDEKSQFSNDGIAGKLAAICECCGLAPPDYGRRPYRTVRELKKLRNTVAHPRPLKIGGTVKYQTSASRRRCSSDLISQKWSIIGGRCARVMMSRTSHAKYTRPHGKSFPQPTLGRTRSMAS